MKYIDIGVNLTSKRFHSDLPEVIDRAKEAKVDHLIITGTSVQASQAAWKIAAQEPSYMSSTAGVHPHDAKDWDNNSAEQIRTLLAQPEVVAVGECGLDFNRDFSPRDQQQRCFEAQLALATEVKKPVFLHQRDAHDPFFSTLKVCRSELSGAVVHCFTGSREEMEAYIDLDCYIGITGWLCDNKRGQALRELVQYIPLEKLMIETDAPYLTPHNLKPKPKNNRNEPAFLPIVLQTLAEILDIQEEELATKLYDNTVRFFSLQNT